MKRNTMANLIKKFLKKKPEPAKPAIKRVQPKKAPVKTADQERLAKAYSILQRPHLTEKAVESGQYAFRVAPRSNKIEVKRAVESLYGVKVMKVRMIHVAPKRRRVGRRQGWRGGLKKGFKKALVTLKKGDKIENF